ncbi:MAG: hypothetical protein EWM72_02247 [Nitrospira sp.]|nr:MAG: hypothetical protein EWM72_02247 [Nitrospira sp.]
MNLMPRTDVFFYPFHLCHERTLERLLAKFARVHFRDFMALQLSPFCGTTAYPDRMGDSFPDLVTVGRLLQGYNVSGPLSPETVTAIDRDLSDPSWRALFHTALTEDRRFQRGLFDEALIAESSMTHTDKPSLFTRLRKEDFPAVPFTVAGIGQLSRQRLTGRQADPFDYGLALLKTSASLVYTIQLAAAQRLAMATDSHAHFTLLALTAERDGITLENYWIERSGY